MECGTPEREQARYTGSLDHKALLTSAANLIPKKGSSAWYFPKAPAIPLLRSHGRWGWNCALRTDISDTEGRLPHRVLLALSPKEGECFNDRMVIRGPDQRYSEDYTALTQAFYLFM
ncbi:tRNA (adenine-N(6)-)-methyltransferase [Enterobacter cloacae]|uniref:tRNA (Adenine-N(6)-)-methyltransferase n=1 Tax=Enterobacter cloacae TaxID=550 RepID=A0A377LX55_ENTCL|nr:tRNA (adenine-N(6)-)-methyltransferase [Enterobacter cloacae]